MSEVSSASIVTEASHLDPSAYLQHALAYAEAGYKVFPLWPRSKKPLVRGGFKAATGKREKIIAWWTKWPDANIGIATGAASGLLVGDIDSREGSELFQSLGALPVVPPAVDTGKGVHLYYELPPDCGKIKCSTGSGLDIRADGGYVVAPPSIHPSGNAYMWRSDGPEAPVVAPAFLIDWARNRKTDGPGAAAKARRLNGKAAGTRSLVGQLQTTLTSPEPYSERAEARLRSALAVIPPGERDVWVKVGMALHDLTRGDPAWAVPARRLWDEWSATCHYKYSPEGQEKAWASFDRDLDGPPVTVGTIFGWAKDAGWVDPANAIAVRLSAALEAPASDGSPVVITVVDGEIASTVDEAEAAIIRSGHPMFVRAGALVRPISEEMPAAKGRTTTVAKLCEMTTDSMIDLLAKAARFQKYDARSGRMVRIDPPEKVAKVLLSREGSWNAPRIAGVITTPTIRPDGSILAEPGYDPSTRLFLMPDSGLTLPPQPEPPTRNDALAALKLFSDLLSGFPFVSPVDRAVALSGIVTSVLRGAMNVAPMHVIRAHTPGTGKSHLVDVAAAVATGRQCPVIAFAKSSEENEKRLGALLKAGVSIVSLDNVNGELKGDALCQIAERPIVRIRVLGTSDVPEFECRAMIFATGNNAVIVGDMVRRAVICNLDANEEQPERRSFPFDPVKHVLEDRGRYVAAALTIPRAYKAAGSPRMCAPVGSYGEWSELVRAPLIWLDEGDPVASMDAAREEDPELTSIRELFEQLKGLVGIDKPCTTSQIIQVACQQNAPNHYLNPEFRDLLLRVAPAGTQVSSKTLGRWLTSMKGRIVEGFRLAIRTDDKRGNQYVLVRA